MKLNSETKLLLVMGVFVLFGGGALLMLGRSNSPDAAAPVPTPPPPPTMSRATFDSLVQNARHVEGTGSPRLTIVEFADFQCPSCRHAYDALIEKANIVAKAPAKLVFYNLPLPTLHLRALPAAIAAEAAAKQGKFWPMYNLLFAGQTPHLDAPDLDRDATRIGLSLDQFHKDEADPSVAATVDADRQLAAKDNVTETPTFYYVQSGDSGDPQVVVGAANMQNAMSKVLGPSVVPTAPASSVASGAVATPGAI